jgi:hypothetical protein
MVKITQGKKKNGELYYTYKTEQDGILNITDGRYDAEKTTLSVMLTQVEEGDIEVIAWENKKMVTPQPYEFPLLVHIKLDPLNGSNKEKGIHKLFTDHPDLKALAGGFAGEIGFSDSLTMKKIANGTAKPDDYKAIIDIVAFESKIDPNGIPSGAGTWGAGSKGQTEAERLGDRMAFLTKLTDPESKDLETIGAIAGKFGLTQLEILTILLG